MVNFLVGSIDAPGGHLGVNLDEHMIDWVRCEPGECGMMKGEPHQLMKDFGFSQVQSGKVMGHFNDIRRNGVSISSRT